MCALDALGIAAMLGKPTEISSHDPLSGTPITVRVAPDGTGDWTPREAAVLAARTGCGGPSFESCCGTLNFFESHTSADQYLDTHPEVSGEAIPIPEASEAGCEMFGGVLTSLAR